MDEDDIHFCMKCKTEIHGLEQYIQHRKDGCPALQKTQGQEGEQVVEETHVVDELSVWPIGTDADDVSASVQAEALIEEAPSDVPRVGRPRRKQRTPKVRAMFVDPDQVSDGEEDEKHIPPPKRGRPKGSKKGHTTSQLKTGYAVKKVPKARRKPKKWMSCDYCNFETSTEKRMEAHNNTPMHQESVAREEGKERQFRCHICEETFCLDRALRSHSRVHSSKAVCQQCGTSFNTKVSLRKHLAESGHSTKYCCGICGKEFPIEAHLKVHMTVHMDDKPYSCVECDFKTKRRADLNIHMKRHLGIKPFKCTLCTFKSVKRSVLTRHMETHKDRPRDLICEVCGAAYCSKMVLQHHIFTQHQNGRRYKCDFEGCTYIFCYKSELVAHKRSHTKEKPYLCSVCGYEGSNTYALTKHMRIHTKEKPFVCPFPNCKYASRFSAHLVRHKRLHTGEKPYKCPFCNYRCNAQENLRKHVRNTKKHAGKNMYMCKDCEFTTNSYKDLVHHTRSQHGNEYIKLQDVSRVCGIFQPGVIGNPPTQNIVEQAFAESLRGTDDMQEDIDQASEGPKVVHDHKVKQDLDGQEETEAELVIDQTGLIHQAISQATGSISGPTSIRNGEQHFQLQAAPQSSGDYLVIGQVYNNGARGQPEIEHQQLEIATSGTSTTSQSYAEAMRCLAQGPEDRLHQVSFVVTNIVHKDGTIAGQASSAQTSQEVAIHAVPQANGTSQYQYYSNRGANPSHPREEGDVVSTPVQIVAATTVANAQQGYVPVVNEQVEIRTLPMVTSYQTVAADSLPSTSRQAHQAAPSGGEGSSLPFSQSLVQAVQRVRETTDEVTAVTILQEMDANADRILQQKDNN